MRPRDYVLRGFAITLLLCIALITPLLYPHIIQIVTDLPRKVTP